MSCSLHTHWLKVIARCLRLSKRSEVSLANLKWEDYQLGNNYAERTSNTGNHSTIIRRHLVTHYRLLWPGHVLPCLLSWLLEIPSFVNTQLETKLVCYCQSCFLLSCLRLLCWTYVNTSAYNCIWSKRGEGMTCILQLGKHQEPLPMFGLNLCEPCPTCTSTCHHGHRRESPRLYMPSFAPPVDITCP